MTSTVPLLRLAIPSQPLAFTSSQYKQLYLNGTSIIMNKNIKHGLLISSPFFQSPLKPVTVKAVCSEFDLVVQINPFIKGITNLYRFNTGSAHLVTTLVRLILLFIFIVASHDSCFITALMKHQKYLVIPQFVLILILKVCARVRSNNRITSWTEGQLVGLNIDNLINNILELDRHAWSKALSDTPFYRCASDSRLFNELKSGLTNALSREPGQEWHCKLASEMAQFSESVSHTTPIEMFSGYLDTELSNHLGIYRFHRSSEDDIYYVSQSSCAGVSVASLDLFSCFLRIFKPVFYLEGQGQLPEYLLPGDSIFDVSGVPLRDCWEKYLSFSTFKRNPPVINEPEPGLEVLPMQRNINDNNEADEQDLNNTIIHYYLDNRMVFKSRSRLVGIYSLYDAQLAYEYLG